MSSKNHNLESILDLNYSNVWTLSETEVSYLWHKGAVEPEFASNIQKMKNMLRQCFDLETFNGDDEREKTRFANLGYEVFAEDGKNPNMIAVRKKQIKRITDLSYENIKYISAATLIELLENNFGGGWDSIALSIRDIIESGFDISTTMLPSTRLHAAGGTLERKVADGFEVLEIPKGTWIEAIFAKKRELVEVVKYESKIVEKLEDELEDDDRDDDDDLDDEKPKKKIDEDEDEDLHNDDTFYETYIPEADIKDTELDDL